MKINVPSNPPIFLTVLAFLNKTTSLELKNKKHSSSTAFKTSPGIYSITENYGEPEKKDTTDCQKSFSREINSCFHRCRSHTPKQYSSTSRNVSVVLEKNTTKPSSDDDFMDVLYYFHDGKYPENNSNENTSQSF